MIDHIEALKLMHQGNVVRYIGTVNGPVWKRGASFCMCRGVLFRYRDGRPEYRSDGAMVYDPDFRYELTGETVDPRDWPTKPTIIKTPRVLDRETKSALSLARAGLWGRI